MNSLRIGITKSSHAKYLNYANWLHRINPECECIDLSIADNPLDVLSTCHGFLLPGGGDVNPPYFGKHDENHVCKIDSERDRLELMLIDVARGLEIPILGICRGLQIMNVALGGTLILDLPSVGKKGHEKINGNDVEHDVGVIPNSHLAEILKVYTGTINSAHHQAVEIVAPLLKITAQSPDGIVEALEWKEPRQRQYLMLVQWHPERMKDLETNEYSVAIAKDFLRAAADRQA